MVERLRPLIPFVATRAPEAMVTTVDALASSAAVAVLRAGGSAADGAIAANAVLAVTAQHMCGMGGDLFALVHEGESAPVALNASGRAGSGADAAALRAAGATRMPYRGDIRSVTIPGCVDGWCALHERFGRLPLADALAPAIAYARDGFPASPLLARSAALIAGIPESDDFRPGLAAGERVRRPGLARALEAIARDGRPAWYEGEFGTALLALGDGEFTAADLQEAHADWTAPLVVRAWQHDIWTVPPNSQGYLTLAAAWMAARLDLPRNPHDPSWPHLLIEAAKQAGHDRVEVLHEAADGVALLDPARLAPRLAAIDSARAAALTVPAAPGGTTHVNVVAGGMAVSLTQSNCAGFGAHLVVPGVRVFLQNRGSGFSLVPGHPAEYGPHRRPPHTLCPTLVTATGGRARFALGTMGADNQPMTLLQLLARLLHSEQDPADAVAAARWSLAAPSEEPFAVWSNPRELRTRIEGHAPPAWPSELADRGQHVEVTDPFTTAAGLAQIIEIGDDMLTGVADPRALVGSADGW